MKMKWKKIRRTSDRVKRRFDDWTAIGQWVKQSNRLLIGQSERRKGSHGKLANCCYRNGYDNAHSSAAFISRTWASRLSWEKLNFLDKRQFMKLSSMFIQYVSQFQVLQQTDLHYRVCRVEESIRAVDSPSSLPLRNNPNPGKNMN